MIVKCAETGDKVSLTQLSSIRGPGSKDPPPTRLIVRSAHVLDHFCDALLVNVTDFVFRQNVVIARVKVAIVLDDGNIPAGFAVNAKRMFHAEKRPDRFIEELDENFADVVVH